MKPVETGGFQRKEQQVPLGITTEFSAVNKIKIKINF